MTSYVTPKKGFPFICYVGLVSQSTGQFQSNPTLAAGDFKISKDGGALGNLATLPAVTPASSKSVKISLDSDETNADNLVIIGSDAAGAEWDDIFLNVQTTVSQIDDLALQSGITNIQSRIPAALSGDGFMKSDMKSIDDELTNGNNATLYLKQLNAVNSDGDAIFAQSTGADGDGIRALGNASGSGIFAQGGATDGIGILALGQGAGDGIHVASSGLGKSINAPDDIAVSDGSLTLAAIAAAVWTYVTRTLTAISDSAGVTTLLSRLTATRAGNLDNLDATISSRASQTSLDTLDDYVDTEVAAIKAKTDNLPSDPADASDIASSFTTVNTKLDAIDDFIDTEVSAIKTKTDQLTFTNANQVDANIQAINDTEVAGDGSGTPWGPA